MLSSCGCHASLTQQIHWYLLHVTSVHPCVSLVTYVCNHNLKHIFTLLFCVIVYRAQYSYCALGCKCFKNVGDLNLYRHTCSTEAATLLSCCSHCAFCVDTVQQLQYYHTDKHSYIYIQYMFGHEPIRLTFVDIQTFNKLTYSPYVSWTMGGAGRYPVAGGAPLALCTPLPLEDGARLVGAPLGAAPRGTAACKGGTPPRVLTQDTKANSRFRYNMFM